MIQKGQTEDHLHELGAIVAPPYQQNQHDYALRRRRWALSGVNTVSSKKVWGIYSRNSLVWTLLRLPVNNLFTC